MTGNGIPTMVPATPAQELIHQLSGGKRLKRVEKKRADGSCGICDKPVPPTNGNLFYCGDACRSAAWQQTCEEERAAHLDDYWEVS